MAKYRLLNSGGYSGNWKEGDTFDEDYRESDEDRTVYGMVIEYPNDWELVEEYEEDESFFKTAYDSLCRMQEAKNKKYGESALQPLDIFAKHHPYGSRIDEKLARVKNCDELQKNDIADIIGSCMLICKDRGWDNFDDLID